MPAENQWSYSNEKIRAAVAESRKWRKGVEKTEQNKKQWTAFVVTHTKTVSSAKLKALGSHDSMTNRMLACIALEGNNIGR